MPAGFQAAYDRVTTLVGTTASLLADGSGETALTRHPSRLDLADMPDTAVHRRFHVLYEGEQPFGGSGGRFAGNLTDSYALFVVQIGYYEGGGDVVNTQGERRSIERVAMDDLNRIRQHVEHPDNYDVGTTGIQLVTWQGTRRLPPRDGQRRRIYEMTFRLWVEHDRLI